MAVLKEKPDDGAILFDPDTNNVFSINPIGVFIWKLLDGQHTQRDIIKRLREDCENVPEEIASQVEHFIKELFNNGLVGMEIFLLES